MRRTVPWDVLHEGGSGRRLLTWWPARLQAEGRGGRGNAGPGLGTLDAAHGLTVDAEGSIYVTEIGDAQRVRKFQRI